MPLALIATVPVPLKFTQALAEYDGAEPDAVVRDVAPLTIPADVNCATSVGLSALPTPILNVPSGVDG